MSVPSLISLHATNNPFIADLQGLWSKIIQLSHMPPANPQSSQGLFWITAQRESYELCIYLLSGVVLDIYLYQIVNSCFLAQICSSASISLLCKYLVSLNH